MDSATAALIGAGAGSVVSLGSQFLANRLSIKRERRHQRRQRLQEAVIEAGTALYGPNEDQRMSDDELKAVIATSHPESSVAKDPELHRDLMPLAESISRGITLLQVHLGHDHALLDEYVEVAGICHSAEASKSQHFRSRNDTQRISDIPELLKTLREAQGARDRWMRNAQAEIDAI